jgi:hypothetical protein
MLIGKYQHRNARYGVVILKTLVSLYLLAFIFEIFPLCPLWLKIIDLPSAV